MSSNLTPSALLLTKKAYVEFFKTLILCYHIEHKTMKNIIVKFDITIIHTLRKISMPTARLAFFIVFFWFGALKVVGISSASPLVERLLGRTLPFITFGQFIVLFGIFEMIIGIIFLIPHLERLAVIFLTLHIITTFFPLVFLTSVTWQGFLTPTLEGQYIIKNLVIIALAIGIVAHLKPFRIKRQNVIAP